MIEDRGNLTATRLRHIGVKDADRDDHFSAWAATESPQLLRLATFLTGQAQAGEDLLQDVLARMYVKWARIAEPSPYARRALANASASRWRGREQRHEITWDVQEVDLGYGPDPFLAQAEQRHDLLAALNVLPARQRAVIVLRYLEDRSDQDVADLLDISVGTVKSQTSRALTRLRDVPSDPFGLAGEATVTAAGVSTGSRPERQRPGPQHPSPQHCPTRGETRPS